MKLLGSCLPSELYREFAKTVRRQRGAQQGNRRKQMHRNWNVCGLEFSHGSLPRFLHQGRSTAPHLHLPGHDPV